jgi:phosphoribosylglycinamide formyltransferase-1
MALIKKASNYKISAVLSNNPQAKGLVLAKDAGIRCITFDKKDFGSIAIDLKPDLIILAGYMQIVEKNFIDQFPDKIINIHPSLLPNYPGLNTHSKVIKAGELEHGCTVHLVIPEVDAGPIIAQAKCQVLKDDSKESLSQRVLQLEHQLYPWVVNCIGSADININNQRVLFSEQAKNRAADAGFYLGDQLTFSNV